jgi:hypothetical protein
MKNITESELQEELESYIANCNQDQFLALIEFVLGKGYDPEEVEWDLSE